MTEKIKNKYIMTREKLGKLLKVYSHTAYWHGEDTGEYGEQDPNTHEVIEKELWEQLDNYRIMSEQFKRQTRIDQHKRCVEEIEKWALALVSCSHELCSMSEAVHEEVFGEQILNIINKYKLRSGKDFESN